MSIAMVFPGQGSHRQGMASAWRGHSAFSTFAEVGRVAGFDDFVGLADDPEACAATDVAQPAVFAVDLAAWRALRDAGITPDVVAGHSLGEIAAAVAARALSVPAGAAVVIERGRAFADAVSENPGKMAAVLGLDRDAVEKAIAGIDGVIVANDNAPDQVVVSGPPDAVDAAADACQEAGGRVRDLDVEGAFHTELMASARDRLETRLDELQMVDPDVPLVSGATAEPVTTADDVRQVIIDGVLSPVRWREVQQRLAAMETRLVIEAGPGDVLSGLARRTLSDDIEIVSVGTPDDLDAAISAATSIRKSEEG
ncbi:MAG: ACP S-malonyltransferase [Actinomycetota bacterium]|nr:ACP S-malonyltransferase [Actinomycetota bacterium]